MSCVISVVHLALSETTKSNLLGRRGGGYGKREGQIVFNVWSLVSRLGFCPGWEVPVSGAETGWTMSAFEKPQIIAHIQKGLNYTVFDCKWVPCSAKFVTMGNFARGTGVIQLYEIQHGDLKLLREVGARLKLPGSGIWDCRWGARVDPGGLHSFLPKPSYRVPQKHSSSCAGVAKLIAG